MTRAMIISLTRGLRIPVAALLSVALPVIRGHAQEPAARVAHAAMPLTRADALLEAGRWAEAEDAFYAQSRVHPREPVARAALGHYLAMKGAIVPGTILIEEAQKFGLDPAVARALLAPWRSVQRSRGTLRLPLDSAIATERPSESVSLFRIPLPSGAARRAAPRQWTDIVPRIIGTDSLASRSRLGSEIVELLVPSFDVASHRVTFHADSRSALSAIGHRYPVLRDEHDIRVLVAPGRVLSLAPALRELDARWWQLDLAHGFVVVR